jgi:hypothetical protein
MRPPTRSRINRRILVPSHGIVRGLLWSPGLFAHESPVRHISPLFCGTFTSLSIRAKRPLKNDLVDNLLAVERVCGRRGIAAPGGPLLVVTNQMTNVGGGAYTAYGRNDQ